MSWDRCRLVVAWHQRCDLRTVGVPLRLIGLMQNNKLQLIARRGQDLDMMAFFNSKERTGEQC
jgi:hypothetical protein